MPNNDYANEPNQSRSEEIIQSILDNTEYDEPARSRIEYLLVELKNAIEGGGGGGGVTSYSPLTEKPKIDNHTLQAGNNTSSDLGLQTKLTFDSTPTESSTNPVTSGGVYTALGTKANSADVYNKSSVDTALSAKADKSTTYTKTEVDTALSLKQNTISDLSTIRSGAALGATAVQPVSGKGLSTNDYTTAEKEKLAGIEAQANKTTVDSALSESSTNPVQNKVVKSALDGKQATLTTAQLAAVNSGITAEKLTQDESNIAYNTNNGVKNLCKPNVSADSEVTYTVNADNSITVTCNTTAIRDVHIFTDLSGLTDGKDYILSGCSGGDYSNTYGFAVRTSSSAGKAFESDGETTFTKTAEMVKMDLIIRAGQNWTKTFYPMIRPAYISDPTYQSYAMSNAELTNNIVSINARYSDNTNVQTDIDNLNKSGIYAVNNTTTFTEAVPYQYGTLFHMEMVRWRMQVMFFASTSYSKPIFRMSNTNTSGGAASVWNKWRFFDGTLVNP